MEAPQKASDMASLMQSDFLFQLMYYLTDQTRMECLAVSRAFYHCIQNFEIHHFRVAQRNGCVDARLAVPKDYKESSDLLKRTMKEAGNVMTHYGIITSWRSFLNYQLQTEQSRWQGPAKMHNLEVDTDAWRAQVDTRTGVLTKPSARCS